MSFKIERRAYVDMFGPTTGDRVRLADTDLIVEVEKDFTTYGEEVKFGGGDDARRSARRLDRLDRHRHRSPAAKAEGRESLATAAATKLVQQRGQHAVSDAPIGCPRAIAPPLTFTRSQSNPSSLPSASTCAAKASLISIRSKSSRLPPTRSMSRRTP